MPLVPGTEPFSHEGDSNGVLVLHGFMGSPASTRPWAEAIAEHGWTVDAPRLPGHGTTWQECNLTTFDDWYQEAERCYLDLRARCERVVVAGLSVGGGLALRLAENYPDLTATVVVNPMIASRDPRARFLLPALRLFLPGYPGVVNDIKKPGGDEVGYTTVPVKAMWNLLASLPRVVEDLPKVHQPLLVMYSDQDHLVDATSVALIRQRVSSREVEYVALHDSYHVATLDNDAHVIFDATVDFVRRVLSISGG